MIQWVLRSSPRVAIGWAAMLVVIIAITDWRAEINATLGFLYIFPMVLLGTVAGWWQVVLAALFCTFLANWLDVGCDRAVVLRSYQELPS